MEIINESALVGGGDAYDRVVRRNNMDPKCTEKMHKVCTRSHLCHLCDGNRLYTEPKWMVAAAKADTKRKSGYVKRKKEGMDFEKRVKKAYEKSITKDVRRTPNSGAIWSMPGDIVTKNELMECKERGTTTGRGEKTISIQKDWIDKVKIEAFQAGREIWYLPFAYKGDDNIYLVKDFHDELALLEQIEILKHRIKELEGEVE